jgi:4'-phosphopantetheinyl transferase
MPVRPSWLTRHGPRGLEDDDIDVWRAELQRHSDALPALARTLSPDELARAGRFRQERDRKRYIFAHGVLRVILARYLERTPQSLSFRYGPAGKPHLARGAVRFNLSHAGDLVLCAVSRTPHVGVDVEQLRPGFEPVMRWLCSPALRRDFFQGWTRLEAQAKARGEAPRLNPRSFAACMAGAPGRHWWLQDFSPRRGYVAAVAARGREPRLRYWEWTSTRSR